MTYFEVFKNNNDICDQYNIPADSLDNAEVLLAWYGFGIYDGCSFVIFKKDGRLYEVNGSHCSCFGLEGQWEPEETSWEVLNKRSFSNYFDGTSEVEEKLKELIKNNLGVVQSG